MYQFCLSKIEGLDYNTFSEVEKSDQSTRTGSRAKGFRVGGERATRAPTMGPNAGRMTTRNKPYSTKTFAAGRQIESEGLGTGSHPSREGGAE